MDITLHDIDIYLDEVKDAIRKNKFRIELNPNREKNRKLFTTYLIDENMTRDILLGLTASDFSEKLQNEHRGYEYERLYVFGKDVELLEKIGNASRVVHLYIKLNKLESCYVIVVSLHEQEYPIKYYFK